MTRRIASGGSSSDTRRIRVVLGRSPHSKLLHGDVLDRLAGIGHIERYKGGELIHAAWQPVRKLWLVLSGGLRVTELTPDGDALTTAVLGEGSYFALGSLVKDGTPVKSEAHAIGHTHLAAFELALIDREFAGDENVQQHRRLLLYFGFSALADFHRDALAVPLPLRLARRLLGHALAAGHVADIELRMSQADIASMLGASRSRVNAELRRLEADGVLQLGYRRIVVRDLELLRAAAGADVAPV